ncbi:MAG: CocE/NonD family hydrolase [Actinomycetota bacterium]|nr:CocE/NonD family hydrolase [Actinomycetota bacterium]
MTRRASLLALLLLGLAAPTASAELVYETHRVPTVDGAEVAVEIMRDDSVKRAPVILTLSPYNTLSEYLTPNLANDDLGQQFVPRGYVRAVADVLGTRNSSGCWDYGGPKETQSGVDLVKWLAKQPWSNGRVGMIGVSYDGTTANMVASQGPRVPELKAIVPIAAISRWYGYAYNNGVRYFLNSEVPSDEGFDTPLAFDFALARTPPTDVDDPKAGEKLASRIDPCEAQEHTERGYLEAPDYDDFWKARDYRRRAADFRAATLVAHGWQDYNVKQEEGVSLFEALPVARKGGGKRARGVPLKRAWFWQDAHSAPSGDEWEALLEDFFDRFLLNRGTGIQGTPLVMTEGRTVVDGSYESTGYRAERKWPPAQTGERRLWLRRTFDQDVPGVTLPPPSTGETGVLSEEPNREPVDNIFTWVGAPTSEEVGNRDPLNEPGHGYYSLFFGTAPLSHDTRIVGTPRLDALVRTPAGGHLSPVLVDVGPDGTMTTIARGFLNVDYREGLEEARPVNGQWVRASVPFLPQDVTVAEGHRIGVLVQSSNTVWALPGKLGTNNIATGPVPDVSRNGSSLVLPVAPAR